MATATTTRKAVARKRSYPKPTEAELAIREDRVKELTERYHGQVVTLANSDAWRQMLELSAQFRGYSLRNTFLIYLQGATKVRGYKAWQKLNRQVQKDPKRTYILAPKMAKITDPASEHFGEYICVGFRDIAVFDITQTKQIEGMPELPLERKWYTQEGNGPEGLWDALVKLATSRGFKLERNAYEDGTHGYTDYTNMVVSVRPDVPMAEATRIATHELGHVLCDHNERKLSRSQRECEADSVAYIVHAVLGAPIDDSAVDYSAGWSGGDVKVLEAAAKAAHKAAMVILDAVDAPVAEDSESAPSAT